MKTARSAARKRRHRTEPATIYHGAALFMAGLSQWLRANDCAAFVAEVSELAKR